MQHTESYAQAAAQHAAEQDRVDRDEARIKARAKEIFEANIRNPEKLADALAEFAYWPAAGAQFVKDPSAALVAAMQYLLAKDYARFGALCHQHLLIGIMIDAHDQAEVEFARSQGL